MEHAAIGVPNPYRLHKGRHSLLAARECLTLLHSSPFFRHNQVRNFLPPDWFEILAFQSRNIASEIASTPFFKIECLFDAQTLRTEA